MSFLLPVCIGLGTTLPHKKMQILAIGGRSSVHVHEYFMIASWLHLARVLKVWPGCDSFETSYLALWVQQTKTPTPLSRLIIKKASS